MKTWSSLARWCERQPELRLIAWVHLGMLVVSLPFYAGPALNALEGWQTYSGVVVDAADGTPVAGARITGQYVYRILWCPTENGWFAGHQSRVAVRTDAQGRFTTRLYAHSHRLSVGPPDDRFCAPVVLDPASASWRGRRDLVIRLSCWQPAPYS